MKNTMEEKSDEKLQVLPLAQTNNFAGRCKLPEDTLLVIFQFLRVGDIFSVSLCSKQFNSLLLSDDIRGDVVWRRFYFAAFASIPAPPNVSFANSYRKVVRSECTTCSEECGSSRKISGLRKKPNDCESCGKRSCGACACTGHCMEKSCTDVATLDVEECGYCHGWVHEYHESPKLFFSFCTSCEISICSHCVRYEAIHYCSECGDTVCTPCFEKNPFQYCR